MLRVQHHVDIHEPRGIGAGFLALQHVEKIGGVPKARVGRHRLAAVADVLVRRDDHRHLGREPDALAQRRVRGFVSGLRIECREGGDAGAKDVHGVGILDRSDELVERRGQLARRHQLLSEISELQPGGQLALEEQVHGLLKVRALRKVVDGVAAVAQLARAPVDIAHARAVEVHAFQATIDLDSFRCFTHGSPLVSC